MNTVLYEINEHESFRDDSLKELKEMKLDFSEEKEKVKFVGLNFNYQANYYIGIDWLVENQSAIMVNPKVEKLDYLTMFMHCFHCPEASEHLRKIYHIDFVKPPIELTTKRFELTPLLIIHFLNTIKALIRSGLKKNFIQTEENLSSKIKGKLLFTPNFKTNTFKGRDDRAYCRFQEYSIDCLENRILKKALEFVSRWLNKHYKKKDDFFETINFCQSAFEFVSDKVDVRNIQHIKTNPLFKEYKEALRLANMIFKRFSYSIENTNNVDDNKIPPFWIDMSLLFELYVLSKLKAVYGKVIQYQIHGKYGYVDFIDVQNKIIIDTKYKLMYGFDEYEIDNIRQLSGYARDKGVLSKLGIKDEDEQNAAVVDCLIIYPDQGEKQKDNFVDRNLKGNPIEQFTKFWKIGIKLPEK